MDAEILEGEPMPSDAESLAMVIDRRFKYLLTLTSTPKSLTEALVAATKWYAVVHGRDDEGEWGKDLPKGGTVKGG